MRRASRAVTATPASGSRRSPASLRSRTPRRSVTMALRFVLPRISSPALELRRRIPPGLRPGLGERPGEGVGEGERPGDRPGDPGPASYADCTVFSDHRRSVSGRRCLSVSVCSSVRSSHPRSSRAFLASDGSWNRASSGNSGATKNGEPTSIGTKLIAARPALNGLRRERSAEGCVRMSKRAEKREAKRVTVLRRTTWDGLR